VSGGAETRRKVLGGMDVDEVTEVAEAGDEAPSYQAPEASSGPKAEPKAAPKPKGKYNVAGGKAAKKMLPKHLVAPGQKAEDFSRQYPNSTSSLYITSTLNNPNQDELVKCVSIVLHNHVKEGHLAQYQTRAEDEIFNEQLHPLSLDKIDFKKVPTFDLVFDFLNTIYRGERLAPECLVMCLAYLERLIASTEVRMHATNWRRLILGALILASKVWEDQAVWNVDFLSVFPNVSVKDLNELERKFLQVLSYNVGMKASEYAKYYFDLRQRSTEGKFESVKPLTQQQAEKLESNSLGLEQSSKAKPGHKRTKSLESKDVSSSAPVIIN